MLRYNSLYKRMWPEQALLAHTRVSAYSRVKGHGMMWKFLEFSAAIWLLQDAASKFLRNREFEEYRRRLQNTFGKRR